MIDFRQNKKDYIDLFTKLVIPKSKISLNLCKTAPKSLAQPFFDFFTPDSTDNFEFLAS